MTKFGYHKEREYYNKIIIFLTCQRNPSIKIS